MLNDEQQTEKELKRQLKDTTNRLADSERALHQQQAQVDRLTKENKHAEGQLESQQEQRATAEEALRKAKERIRTLEAREKGFEEQISDGRKKLNDQEKENRRLQADLEGSSCLSAKASATEERLKQENISLGRQLKEFQENAEHVQAQQAAAKKQRRSSNEFNQEAANTHIQSLEKEHSATRTRLESAQRDLHMVQNELAVAKKLAKEQLEASEETRESLQYELEALKEGEQLRLSEVDALQKQVEALRAAAAVFDAQHDALQRDRDIKVGQLALVEDESRTLAAQISTLQQENAAYIAEMGALRTQAASIERLTQAHDKLASDLAIAHRQVEDLDAERKRVYARQAEEERELRETKERLEDSTATAVATSKQLRDSNEAQRAADHQLSALHTAHDQLQAEFSAVRQRTASVDRQLEGANAELEQMRILLNEAQGSRSESVRAQKVAEADVKRLNHDLHVASTNLHEVRSEAEALRAEVEAFRRIPMRTFDDSDVKALQARHDELLASVERLGTTLADERILTEGLNEQLAEEHQRLEDLREEYQSNQEILLDRHNDELSKERDTAVSTIIRAQGLEQSVERLQHELAEAQREAEISETMIGQLRQEQQAVKDRRESEAFQLAKSQRQNVDYEHEIQCVRTDLEALQRRFHNQTLAVETDRRQTLEKLAEAKLKTQAAETLSGTLSHDLERARLTIERSEQRITALEAEIATYNAKDCDLVAQLATRSGIAAHDADAQTTMPDATNLDQLLDRLRRERDDAVVSKTFVEAELNTLRDQHQRNMQESCEEKNSTDSRQRDIAVLRASITSAEQVADDCRAELLRAREDLQTVQQERETTVSMLQEHLTLLESDLLAAKKMIERLTDDLEDRNRAIVELEIEKDALLVRQESEKLATFNALAHVEHSRQSVAACSEAGPVPKGVRSESMVHGDASLMERTRLENLVAVPDKQIIANLEDEVKRLRFALAILTPSESGDLANSTFLENTTILDHEREATQVAISTHRIDAPHVLLEHTIHNLIIALLGQRNRYRNQMKAAQQGLAAASKQRAALKDRLDHAKLSVVESTEQHGAVLARLERALNDLRTAEAALEGSEIQIKELLHDKGKQRDATLEIVSRIEAERDALSVQLVERTAEVGRATEALKEASDAQIASRTGSDVISGKFAELQAKAMASIEQQSYLQQQLTETTAQLEAANDARTEAETTAQEYATDNERLRGIETVHMPRLSQELATLRLLLQQREAENRATVEESQSLVDDFNAATAELDRLGERNVTLQRDSEITIDRLRDECRNLQVQRQSDLDKLEELNHALSKAREDVEEADDKLHEALKANKRYQAAAEKYKIRFETLNRDMSKTDSAKQDTVGTKRGNHFADARTTSVPARGIAQPISFPHRPVGPSDQLSWRAPPNDSAKPFNFVPEVAAPPFIEAPAEFKPGKPAQKSRAVLAALPQCAPPSSASSLQARLAALKTTRM